MSRPPRTGPAGSPFVRLARLLRAQPALGLLPLRLFLGFTFSYAGLQKLADPSFLDAHNPRSLQGQLALVRSASPLRFMLGPVADHAVFFGVVIALTELCVGVGTLLGLWQRFAALVGAALALSFFLTISWSTTPYYYGSDIGFAFAWTPLLILGAPVLSLDAWRLGRPQLPVVADGPSVRSRTAPAPTRGRAPAARGGAVDRERRAVLTTGAVGAAVLALAGLDAGVGRVLHRRRTPSSSAGPGPSTPSSGRHSRSGPAASPGSGSPPATSAGTVIGTASAVPVGSAARFTDPASGQSAWLVHPSPGQFKAFNATCTHAGCTVAFVSGTQQFQCPCHGGVYDAKTGQVLAGPPPSPLQSIPVEKSGGKLVVPDGS